MTMLDGTIPRRPTVLEIQTLVATHFGISVEQMIGRRRGRAFVEPRQIAVYLVAELTAQSSPWIARRFHRDHSTVLYSHRIVAARRKEDPAVATLLARLESELMAGAADAAAIVHVATACLDETLTEIRKRLSEAARRDPQAMLAALNQLANHATEGETP